MTQASIKSPKLSLEKYWVFLNKPRWTQEPICNHSWWPSYSCSKSVVQRPTLRTDRATTATWFQLFEGRFPQSKIPRDGTENLYSFPCPMYSAFCILQGELGNKWMHVCMLPDILTKQVTEGNPEIAIPATFKEAFTSRVSFNVVRRDFVLAFSQLNST